MGCRPVVLGVVLVKAISILVHTSARGAACGSVSVVRPNAAARIVAALVLHASARPFMGAAAQHAAVADAATRPRDRAVFEGQYRSDVIPLYWCGAAKRQHVGRQSNVQLSRS